MSAKTKKTYEKPSLTKVELRPDEAVLTACKNAGGAGGPDGGCGSIRMCAFSTGS
jgi:hypothetical protein